MDSLYLERWARLLVKYSTRVKRGDRVIIAGGVVSEPLIREVYREVLRAGGIPHTRVSLDGLDEIFYQEAGKKQLLTVTPLAEAEAEHCDVFIRILSDTNTKSLSRIDPKRQALVRKARHHLTEKILKKRWVLTLYPTLAYAQDAEMSLADYETFVVRALFVDKKDPVREWRKIRALQADLIKSLRRADRIAIKSPSAELEMSVKGRKFINSCGTNNMPSGEIFTGPVETSVNGWVKYSFPACYGGREVDGVRLEFRDGVVVDASAEKNEQFLHEMLEMDPGARRLGELGIGTNYGIQEATKDILFDEKIGGTVHLALGSSYPETGGRNQSALHWDMVLDLRQGGEILVDGKVFQKNGKFRKLRSK